VCARRFFWRYMSTGVHCGDQERNERVVRTKLVHANWPSFG